jgi:uncharacterized repeat protein (TIGR03803 family)
MKTNMRCVARSFVATSILMAGFVISVRAQDSIEAPTYAVLFGFDITSGAAPFGGLVADAAGNLYGTTTNGDSVFKLDTEGNKTVLHFLDGIPFGTLLLDPAGNLYGTTWSGGVGCPLNRGCGTVYRVDAAGNETILHQFHFEDGANPRAGLVRAPNGNLYGTTINGGEHRGGTVFQLDQTTNHASILHSFSGGAEGFRPYAGLITDEANNLYGEATFGGRGCGVVFKMDQSGSETVLYDFPRTGANGCFPMGGLTRDSSGNLYGTTEFGGTYQQGVLFKLDELGRLTVLHEFTGGVDGGSPNGGLVVDGGGNVFGTTVRGGFLFDCGTSLGCGVVFKVDHAGNETVLHQFAGACRVGDGAEPESGLLWFNGSFYGTTSSGGIWTGGECDSGWGAVFKLTL